uniref:Uncharacterized protein LOC103410436 isoform X2 n=1 Tax=Rhizophora mucronata TaxID=61149 RepID=A0A2P2P332_RHIMU
MPSSRRIYNVVDDDPAPREDVFAYAEKLIEKKWPGMVKQWISSENEFPIKRSNSRSEKRVSNARMKSELKVRLLHPCYRSGLESIVDQMQKPFGYGSLGS